MGEHTVQYRYLHISRHSLAGEGVEGAMHRVDRVLGVFFSRPNWDFPTPSPVGYVSPPLVSGWGGHSLAG